MKTFSTSFNNERNYFAINYHDGQKQFFTLFDNKFKAMNFRRTLKQSGFVES